jgi:hypothetical protein
VSTGLPHAPAIGHPGRCGWFWAWAAVGFGLVLSFAGIFSIGPFLIPFVTLLLGAAAARRSSIAAITAGLLVATAGIAASLLFSQWAFLATPLVTLAIGIAPAVPRGVQGVLRVALTAAIVAACAVAAVSASPAPDTVLVAMPLALSAFALAVGGRLDAEVTGAITGAGMAAVLLGGPPACLLLAAAGLAAFPLLRPPAGAEPLPR